MEDQNRPALNYKFKELLVSASPEWLADGRKKYRRVFSQAEVSQIYVELSFFNKRFDEEAWLVNTSLKAFRRLENGQEEQIAEIETEREVSTDQNIVYVRELHGGASPGAVWTEGAYLWRAYLDGAEAGECRFWVYDLPPVTAEENPFFEVLTVRLYESDSANRFSTGNPYYQVFDSRATRYIYVEFSAENRLPDRDWWCEIMFRFYNDAGQLKGNCVELVHIERGNPHFVIRSGWGSDFKGTWFPDNYTMEVVFMDTLIGLAPFRVDTYAEEGEVLYFQPLEGRIPGASPMLQEAQQRAQTMEEALVELDRMIGLEGIKKRVREYAQYLQFLQLRRAKGMEDNERINLHAVFAGNPGTGKTTVARLLGVIYHELGLLSKGHVHEVDRADLVGEYIGQTAPKVKEAINSARGGILFIDEAYALSRGDDNKDYGREVVEVLVKELSDGPGDLAVIVAGYPKEMEQFLNLNPGLRSRFTLRFDFPDYLPQELEQIAMLAAQHRHVQLAPDAQRYISHQLTEAYRKRDRSFGNARYVYMLMDEAKMNLGLRVIRSGKATEALSDDDLSIVTLEDMQEVFEREARAKARIPVDEAALHQCIEELNRLTGLHSVKNEVHELIKLVRFYRETGRDVLNRFSLHTVFTGNPGTGKTTVARLLGQMFKALGILERGALIECDRQALVAGYVGQTAIKTAEVIESARGSVLFIDEAYALSGNISGDFGQEAIETLLKRMEDLRGELIVIVAGYTDRMKAFLDANPGLRSRFDRQIHFPDYDEAELMEIAKQMLAQEQLNLTAEAENHLGVYLHYLYENRNKFFGNARAVRKLVEKTLKNQNLRLASMPADARNAALLATVTLDDVREFSPGSDSLLEGGGQGRIGF